MNTGLKTRTAAASRFLLLATFMAVVLPFQTGHPKSALSSEFIKPGSGVQIPSYRKAPDIRQVLRDGRVIHREAVALTTPWVINKELSQACSRGLFKQHRDRHFIAIFDRRVYGAAVGAHGSLVDKTGLAEKQVIYLFDGQGTTDCRVYHRGRA